MLCFAHFVWALAALSSQCMKECPLKHFQDLCGHAAARSGGCGVTCCPECLYHVLLPSESCCHAPCVLTGRPWRACQHATYALARKVRCMFGSVNI